MAFKISKTVKGRRYDYLATTLGGARSEAYAGASPATRDELLAAAARLAGEPRVAAREPWFPAVFHPTLAARVRYLGDYISFAAQAVPDLGKKISMELAVQAATESNRIEGSRLERKDMDRIVRDPAAADARDQDVRAAVNALAAAAELKSPKFRLTVKSVIGLYRVASRGLAGPDGLPLADGFRKDPATVGLSQHATAAAADIRGLVADLVEWANSGAKGLDPLEAAFTFHLTYEAIHPFEDVNGRTGRLIMNWLAERGGAVPVVVHMENRAAYFSAIEDGRSGRRKKYLKFMLGQAMRTYSAVVEKFGMGKHLPGGSANRD